MAARYPMLMMMLDKKWQIFCCFNQVWKRSRISLDFENYINFPKQKQKSFHEKSEKSAQRLALAKTEETQFPNLRKITSLTSDVCRGAETLNKCENVEKKNEMKKNEQSLFLTVAHSTFFSWLYTTGTRQFQRFVFSTMLRDEMFVHSAKAQISLSFFWIHSSKIQETNDDKYLTWERSLSSTKMMCRN